MTDTQYGGMSVVIRPPRGTNAIGSLALKDGEVIRSGKALEFCVGKSFRFVQRLCQSRHWKMAIVKPPSRPIVIPSVDYYLGCGESRDPDSDVAS